MFQSVSIFREQTNGAALPALVNPAAPVKLRGARERVIHFNHLDGIRALAASYVVLGHHVLDVYDKLSPALQHLAFWFQSGHYAVDVFIVLSGYCLMLPIARRHGDALPSSLGEYIRRRALRILPPYFAALILSLVVLIVIGRGGDVSLGGLISHLLLVHNLSPKWVWTINPPLWSVAVEWQIYFAFPLLLLPIRKIFGGIACVAIALVLGVLPHFLLPRGANLEWSFPWYLGLFAMGMASADLTYQEIANEKRLRRCLLVCGLALFGAVAWSNYRDGTIFVHPYIADTLLGISAGCGLAWAGRHCQDTHGDSPWVIRCLGCGPLILIGSFSYSLYLIHVPVWLALEPLVRPLHLAPAADLAVRVLIGFPAALLAAYAFFLAVEKPSMALRSRKKFIAAPAVASNASQRAPLTLFVQRASECLTDYFPNGDGLICFSLLNGLAQRGHRIFAYTNRDEVQARPPTLEIKAHKHRVPANSLADFEHSWRAARWLKQLEKTEQIDLVWRMQPLGESCPTVPYTNGRPLVLGQMFYPWPAESVGPADSGKPRLGIGIRTLVSPMANWGWARALRSASLVLCTTDPLSQQTRMRTTATVMTLPVIVDPPANLVANRPRPLIPGKLKLLFVANLYPNKNPLIFCQTIHRLRQMGVDAAGDILGDGPERQSMEAWCREKGVIDFVQFVGRVSNLEVYRHLSEADGLISTSLGEPYGRSIVEAMSVSGVPICHRSGGPADIIIDGVDGLLVDRLDAGNYADAIFKFWTEPGAWQRLSTAAMEKSIQWKPAAVIDRLEDALYSVVGQESVR